MKENSLHAAKPAALGLGNWMLAVGTGYLVVVTVMIGLVVAIPTPPGSIEAQLREVAADPLTNSWGLIVSSLISPFIVTMLVLLAVYAPRTRATGVLDVVGIVFAGIYSLLASVVYTSQYALLPRLIDTEDPSVTRAWYVGNPSSISWLFEHLAYTFLALAALAIGYKLLFERGVPRWTGWAMWLMSLVILASFVLYCMRVEAAGTVLMFGAGVSLLVGAGVVAWGAILRSEAKHIGCSLPLVVEGFTTGSTGGTSGARGAGKRENGRVSQKGGPIVSNKYVSSDPGRRRRPAMSMCTLLVVLITVSTAACSPDASTTQTPQPQLTPAALAEPTATAAYSNSAVIEKYRQLIPQIMKEQNIPGLSLAVVDDQQVLWAEGFGVTDPVQNRPVTADTLFSIQSMSKNFTAVGVLMAAQDGLVNMDTPISAYLPEFHVNSIFEEHPEQKMTLTNLLGHTAGFTHEAPVGNNSDIGPCTFEEHIKSISDTWLMFPVGQKYNYSNNGPDLAGYILQLRSGMPFEQYMQRKLLDPIGMTHSTFDISRIEQVQDRAIGHDQRVTMIPVAVSMIPAGGLYSSANDMAKYVQFQINGGVVGSGTEGTSAGTRLVPQSLLDTVDAPPSPLTRQQGEGYGVFVGRRHDTYYIGSGGGGFGFLSDMLWYPELKLGIVLLTNSVDHNLHARLDGEILDDMITDPQSVFHARAIQLNNTTVAPWEKLPGAFVAPPPTPDVAPLIRKLAPTPTAEDRLRWQTYVGTYGEREWGQILITVQLYERDGRLYGSQGDTTFPATEVRPGVFFADNGEAMDLRGPVLTAMGVRITRLTTGTPAGTP